MSEDELTSAPLNWEWLYSSPSATGAPDEAERSPNPLKRKASTAFTSSSDRRIIGVCKGTEQYMLGDAVRLKAARNEQWVALIVDFLREGSGEDEDEKEAKFMWFTSPKEIRNKAKRRGDALSVRAMSSGRVDSCVPC